MAEPMYFQWQNEFLCKTIYPMREPKLRDFLVYYMEIDLWKQYKDKDIATLKADVDAYTKAQEAGGYYGLQILLLVARLFHAEGCPRLLSKIQADR